jgi:hypothetical protein
MGWRWSACLALACGAYAQVIEFEANGLKYQTLTRRGVTVMYAPMPEQIRGFSVLQVAVSNGSGAAYPIGPENFRFQRQDGTVVQAMAARTVVRMLLERGSRDDVIKLVSTYESALYGMWRLRPTNGYESRRQAALAEVSSTKLKAAAAASAIALVPAKLAPGQSTDGAVFFLSEKVPLGPGKITVVTQSDTFEFHPQASPPALEP